jgi:hypothetical protein
MHGRPKAISPASAASRRGSFFATAVGGHHRRRAKAKSRNRSLLIARGTGSSNPFPSTRESGEVGGSSGSVAHGYLQLHAIVRTQLGGPPTVAGFKVLILRLQPRAEPCDPRGCVGRTDWAMSCQDCCSVNFSLWGTRWRISLRVIVICVSRSTDISRLPELLVARHPICRRDRVCMTRRWRKMDSSNRSPVSRPATRTTFRSSLVPRRRGRPVHIAPE